MKYLIVLFLSFYQVDMAFAEDATSTKMIEQHLEKMSKLTVFAMKLPPRLIQSFNHPMVVVQKAAPLSCDVTAQTNRSFDSSCDAIKTLKTETLAIAAN